MRARAALLIAALALAGCSTRERLNPFDPANPATNGRPAGFEAIAGDQGVTLRWQPPASSEVAGFRLERRGPLDSDFVLLADVPRDVGLYGDLGLANGSTYAYRLYFRFAAGPGAVPAEDHATPGRARIWASDFDGGALVRVAPDGRHVAERVTGSFDAPTEVALDAVYGIVWASDPLNGQVVGAISGSVQPYAIAGFSQPGALAVDPLDHTLWVCDELAGSLRHYQPTGAPGFPAALGPFQRPLGVAFDPNDRSLWMCEQLGNAVRRYATNGVPTASATVDAPSRLAVDSLTREVWVTSNPRGQVVKLSAQGAPLDTLTDFAGPVGVAVDARRGRIWVADPVADEVVALRRDGTVEFRVRGLAGARMVAVEPASGEAWVVATSAGTVVRLSPGGTVLERVGGFTRPWSIAVQP